MPDNSVTVTSVPATSITVNDGGQVIAVPGAATTTVAQPVDVITTVSTANLGPQGPAGVSNFETVHTYAIAGNINTTDFIPPMFFQKLAGQTSTLKKVVYRVQTGTSATVKLQRNGSDITGYTAISATTSKAATLQDQVLADGDELALVVTAISGTPANLTFTLVIEHDL